MNEMDEWMNSPKYKLFQQMLKEKREKAREDLLKLKNILMKNEKLMTKKELEKFIDDILESSKESEGDIEWLQMILLQDITRDDMFIQFIKTVHTWYIYLFVHERKENYELCARIMQVLQAETDDLRRMIEIKFKFTPDDESYIQDILEEYRIQITEED